MTMQHRAKRRNRQRENWNLRQKDRKTDVVILKTSEPPNQVAEPTKDARKWTAKRASTNPAARITAKRLKRGCYRLD